VLTKTQTLGYAVEKGLLHKKKTILQSHSIGELIGNHGKGGLSSMSQGSSCLQDEETNTLDLNIQGSGSRSIAPDSKITVGMQWAEANAERLVIVVIDVGPKPSHPGGAAQKRRKWPRRVEATGAQGRHAGKKPVLARGGRRAGKRRRANAG